jgi:hypothetical protein
MSINWSYRYRGNVARTSTKKIQGIVALKAKTKGAKPVNPRNSHPPRKRIQKKTEIKIMLAYSPRKNIAKGREE